MAGNNSGWMAQYTCNCTTGVEFQSVIMSSVSVTICSDWGDYVLTDLWPIIPQQLQIAVKYKSGLKFETTFLPNCSCIVNRKVEINANSYSSVFTGLKHFYQILKVIQWSRCYETVCPLERITKWNYSVTCHLIATVTLCSLFPAPVLTHRENRVLTGNHLVYCICCQQQCWARKLGTQPR